MHPIEQFEQFFTMFRAAWIVALVLSVVQAVVVLYLLILGVKALSGICVVPSSGRSGWKHERPWGRSSRNTGCGVR